MPEERNPVLAHVLDRSQLAFDAARAETRRDQHAVRAAQHVEAVVLDQLRVDSLDLDRCVVEDAGVRERLADRNVRVLEFDVLADQRDRDVALRMKQTLDDRRPNR